MNQLTKREQIAVEVMKELLRSPTMFKGHLSDGRLSVSVDAVASADALLAELAKGEKETPKEGTVCWISDEAMAEIKAGDGFVASGEESGWHNHKVLVTIL